MKELGSFRMALAQRQRREDADGRVGGR